MKSHWLNWLWLTWKDWMFRVRQPGRWMTVELENVPIAPIEELLMRWAGGSIWRGGPQLTSQHPKCPGLMHYRGNELASDPVRNLKGRKRWPVVQERLFWCGPIVSHFGHQLGEFGGRILLSSLDLRHGALLFIHPEGDRQLKELLTWQQDWIQFLNPSRKDVIIRKGRFQANRLVVVPQQQRLGECPSPKLLQALTQQGRYLNAAPIEQIVVLSRVHHSGSRDGASLRGAVAGEAAFDTWMERRGALVLYPEQLPFIEQLKLLHNATKLVVAEGSALHTLELLGWQPNKQLVVIARRPLWAGMEQPLRSRFPRLQWIDAVENMWWQEPSNPRVKGLAQLNWHKVLSHLNREFNLSISTIDVKYLEQASHDQLDEIKTKCELKKLDCTGADRRPLRAGGW